MPRPAVLQPEASSFVTECEIPDLPGVDKSATKFYKVTVSKNTTQILPGVDTEIWGYEGLYPGPTIKVKRGEPAIVRFINDLSVELTVHNHGGHQSSVADGFPSDLILPGQFKDYCYPNISPVERDSSGVLLNTDSDFTSTQWYHDHAVDITGQNVYMGLAGFYLLSDDLEDGLINTGVLPGGEFDVPMVIQDRRFAADGSLVYRPEEDNFDGWLGDVFVVNGKAQPKFHVRRRKYRFRILNGANARWMELRLNRGRFLQIGNDSWLLDHAIARDTLRLSPAERAEVIIDFRDAPAEVFLENILEMKDGRRPEDDLLKKGVPLVKFIVDQQEEPVDNATLQEGQTLRPHTPIREDEIVKTRTFKFDRRKGAWAINGEHFDPGRDDATPKLGTAERWILKNSSGGWAHPIHIHLEGQQVQKINGSPPLPQDSFKKDTIQLGPNDEAEVFIKFRTFEGRFVFHCHNLEHEDSFMMGKFNVKP
ncbi:MAG: multicopper oxidase family protein [Nitrospinaceae bacterium]